MDVSYSIKHFADKVNLTLPCKFYQAHYWPFAYNFAFINSPYLKGDSKEFGNILDPLGKSYPIPH